MSPRKNTSIGKFLGFLSALVLLFSGCASPQPAQRPQNVYVWSSSLPHELKRVAFLPVTCDTDNPEMLEGRDALEPIVRAELVKTHRFEITSIAPEALQAYTGRPRWGSEDTLPHDLFPWLSKVWGCDAVLFCRLTVFRGYAPLAVGWRMRLVNVHNGTTLWAGDEVFDASLTQVQTEARHYQLAGCPWYLPGPDAWIISNSPRQFGQYATAQLFATLPTW